MKCRRNNALPYKQNYLSVNIQAYLRNNITDDNGRDLCWKRHGNFPLSGRKQTARPCHVSDKSSSEASILE
jgi:hypothetical protein